MDPRLWHVGIYEPHFSGHRLKYVQYLVKRLSVIHNTKITLITHPNTLKSVEFKTHLAHLAPQIDVYTLAAPNTDELIRSANDCDTDLMVVPDGDSLVWKHIWRTGWQGRGKLAILVMRPTGQSNNIAKRTIITVAKKTLIRASQLRRRTSVYKLSSALENNLKRSYIVPDPITFNPDETQLSRLWPATSLTKRTKWIGTVGALSERKNVPLLLEAAKNVDRANFGIVLAGSIDERTRQAIQAPLRELKERKIPVVVIDHMMTDGQLDAVIKRLHSVVLAHSNEGPSGILGKAVEAGTLVIAAGAHSLRRDCRKITYMSRWSPLKKDSLTRSIEIMLDNDQPIPVELSSERYFSSRLLDLTPEGSTFC